MQQKRLSNNHTAKPFTLRTKTKTNLTKSRQAIIKEVLVRFIPRL
ncbi:hypothetical protein JavanS727_0008 [Streptococcus satellite phage Javan727]|nr:hypothetical protein JavanS727_0008 [Streptococcus satellite phage Javan727]